MADRMLNIAEQVAFVLTGKRLVTSCDTDSIKLNDALGMVESNYDSRDGVGRYYFKDGSIGDVWYNGKNVCSWTYCVVR